MPLLLSPDVSVVAGDPPQVPSCVERLSPKAPQLLQNAQDHEDMSVRVLPNGRVQSVTDAEGITVPITGIAEIDDQHQKLMACFDRLALWMNKGQGLAATFDAIVAVNDYAASHFRFEEDYLRKCAYPQLELHIEEHRRLLDELQGLTARIHQGDEASEALLKLIREWIINHVGSDDMKYARHLSQS